MIQNPSGPPIFRSLLWNAAGDRARPASIAAGHVQRIGQGLPNASVDGADRDRSESLADCRTRMVIARDCRQAIAPVDN